VRGRTLAARLPLGRLLDFLRGVPSFEVMVAVTLYGVPLGAITALRPLEFVLNFVTIAISTAMAVGIVRRRGWVIRRDVLDLLAVHLVFMTYLAASLLWSPEPGYFGTQKVGLAIIVGTWAILSVGILAEEPQRIRRLIVAMITIGAISATQYLLITPDIASYMQAFDQGAQINNQQGARLTGLGVLGAMVYFAYNRGSTARALMLLGLGAYCFMGQINTGGRTGLVATVLVLLLLAALGVRFEHLDIRLRRFVSRMLIALGVFALGLMGYMALVGVPRTIYRLGAFITNPAATTARMPRYFLVWGYLADAPLFGHGAGSWDFLEQLWGANYPHNVLLEVIAELGLVGVALFLALLAFPLWMFIRRHGAWPRAPLPAFTLLFFAYNLLQSMAVGDLGRNNGLYGSLALLTLPAALGQAALFRGPALRPAAAAAPAPAIAPPIAAATAPRA